MRVVLADVAHYKCDFCRRDFSTEKAAHITIDVGQRSGISQPENPLPGWRFKRLLRPGRYNFCLPPWDRDGGCMEAFFKAIEMHELPEYAG